MTERTYDADDEAIELGAASVETKGGGFRAIDSATSLQPSVGISDD